MQGVEGTGTGSGPLSGVRRLCFHTMFDDLTPAERLSLLKLVCSFAWVDHEVDEREKEFVRDLLARLELGEAEQREVEGWLEDPPPSDALDEVPPAHRRLFVSTARRLLDADGKVTDDEAQQMALLELLEGAGPLYG